MLNALVGLILLLSLGRPPEQGQVLSTHISYTFPTPTPTVTPTPSPSPMPTVTPTPIPTRTPTPFSTPKPTAEAATPLFSAPAHLEPLFSEFADKYRVSANLLKKIADCESHFNPGVVSKNGLYRGMFQFTVSTWASHRQAMGADPNPDLVFGAREAIETAAFMISKNGPGAWPACSK